MARRDYKFMPVVDAMTSLNQKINLIGAVIESGIPKVTRRADLFRSIRIIDESESTAGFYIHFFAKTVDKLPHANNFGDILVVSSVKVQEWNSNIHAMFLMQTSSFALYDGRDCSGNEPVPYQTSRNYKSSALDKASAVELRNWLSRNKVEDLAGLSPAMTFEHIKEGESVDFICKILHVCEVEDEWVFFLWDGTDTPPTTIKAKLEDEMEKPLPLQLEPSLLSRDILCTFPPVGTVLRMFVDKGIKKHGLKSISSNRWVKFLHVKCEIRAGLWCAGLMTFTKFFHLPDDADYVVQRQRSYDERVASRLQRMPVTSVSGQSSITGTDHPHVPCMTLMNVLIHPEVVYKFKCAVRVVAILPWNPKDFRNPRGVYRMRLTLEDASARIHAYLYAEDAERFFGESCSIDMLTKKRNTLLGIADGEDVGDSRNPPLMECCLQSYYQDENDVWGSRKYRIFATTMVD